MQILLIFDWFLFFVTIQLSSYNFRLYENARHELHNEINREEVFGDIRSWFKENGISL